MFSTLFLLSCGLLIAALAGTMLLRKWPRTFQMLVLVFMVTTVFFFAGMVIEKMYPEKFALLHPWTLTLLIIPVAVLAISGVFRSLIVKRINYPLVEILSQSGGLRALLTKWLPLGLNVVALCFIVIALARPVAVDRTVLPPAEGVDIILVLDVSSSMARQDFYPNRFVAAMKTASDFIGKRINDRIGIVAFASSAMLQAPLTLDHEALQDFVASLFMGIVNPNATAIGEAIAVAANHLKDSSAKSKIIVLLTDGASNAGVIEPLLAAKAAAAYGIKIYTVATASPPGTNLFSSADEEIDEALLMQIAEETGGKFYRAKNELELQKIYNTINELEKTKFVQNTKMNHTDIYLPFVVAAMALLLLAFILEKVFLIKVP